MQFGVKLMLKSKATNKSNFSGLKNIPHPRTDLYDVSTVEYKFVHTQSSCNRYCVSNISQRSRIFIDVSKCTIYLAAVLGNTTACKRYPLPASAQIRHVFRYNRGVIIPWS